MLTYFLNSLRPLFVIKKRLQLTETVSICIGHRLLKLSVIMQLNYAKWYSLILLNAAVTSHLSHCILLGKIVPLWCTSAFRRTLSLTKLSCCMISHNLVWNLGGYQKARRDPEKLLYYWDVLHFLPHQFDSSVHVWDVITKITVIMIFPIFSVMLVSYRFWKYQPFWILDVDGVHN